MMTSYMDSPLGKIKLAEENGMLTCVHFMDDDEPMETITGVSVLLQKVQEELVDYFEGNNTGFSFLPALGQPGTDFQERVWDALVEIPMGQTISYRELAIRLGDEKCIRAAASANGQNNLAIVVPCHRVIGTDGSLTGYAGGLWRKKWLLDHEAKLVGKTTQGSLF